MSRYSPARYLFEGQQRTVAEIHERYPAYSGTFLRRALGDGATTLAELAIARERGISPARRCRQVRQRIVAVAPRYWCAAALIWQRS